jgi:hypothetical protein
MTNPVVAQVTLRKADGSSILDSSDPITAETLARYRVEKTVVAAAKAKFETLGFTVVGEGPTGFSITGNKADFEQAFQTTLASTAVGQSFTATHPLAIPVDLASLVADVALPMPPTLFP